MRPRPKNSAWAIEVSNFTVLYDACVLYPAPLRDLLMNIAVMDLYRAAGVLQIVSDEVLSDEADGLQDVFGLGNDLW